MYRVTAFYVNDSETRKPCTASFWKDTGTGSLSHGLKQGAGPLVLTSVIKTLYYTTQKND